LILFKGRQVHPRKAVSKAKPDLSNKRLRPDDRITKLAQADEAKKKQKKKEEVQSRKPAVCDFNFVYVGNVSVPQLRTLRM
jgi:hypothetical protein